MSQFLIKTIISALIIAGASELSRRFSLISAILISLPITSILALIWIYQDGHDLQKVIEMSRSIFWLVLPSLLFFILLPVLLNAGVKFYPALAISCAAMSVGYGIFTYFKTAA